MTYTVRCDHPDGGDVIEGRARPVAREFGDLDEALRYASKWYRSGPNGPIRSAKLYRDGILIENQWAEIRRLGMVPLVRRDFAGREILCGCEPASE